MPDGVGYDSDFFLWTQDQAERLRAAASIRSNVDVDWENVAEELESLGKRDRRELSSRLDQIYEHLLKLAFSPALDPRRGWITTVTRERQEVSMILGDSPSLRRHIDTWKERGAGHVRARVAQDLIAYGEDDQAVLLKLADGDEIQKRVLDEGFIPDPSSPATLTSA